MNWDRTRAAIWRLENLITFEVGGFGEPDHADAVLAAAREYVEAVAAERGADAGAPTGEGPPSGPS